MKKCSCCGEKKDKSDFQIRKASRDGLTASCKSCLKERDRVRDQSEHRKKARRDYQKTESGRQAKARSMQKYSERYPLKRAAHIIVGNAIRDGKLIKSHAYEACGSDYKIEAHHDDYKQPLDVRWLCEPCHKSWYRENEPAF